jgi:membrane protein implicated in regulation of membrane protease activity
MARLAVVMLAMLMAYSIMMMHWGVPWQVAAGLPVSLAAASVQLVRRIFAPGVGQPTHRTSQATAEENPGRPNISRQRPALR